MTLWTTGFPVHHLLELAYILKLFNNLNFLCICFQWILLWLFIVFYRQNSENFCKVSLIALYSPNTLKSPLCWFFKQILLFINIPSLICTLPKLYHAKAIYCICTSPIFFPFLVFQSLNKIRNHSLVNLRIILTLPLSFVFPVNANISCNFFSWNCFYTQKE